MIAPPIIDRWQLIFNWTHLIRLGPVFCFDSSEIIWQRHHFEIFRGGIQGLKRGYLNVCHSSVAHMCIRQRLKQASDPSTEWHHNLRKNWKRLECILDHITCHYKLKTVISLIFLFWWLIGPGQPPFTFIILFQKRMPDLKLHNLKVQIKFPLREHLLPKKNVFFGALPELPRQYSSSTFPF